MTDLVEAVEFAKNGTDPKPEDALKNVHAAQLHADTGARLRPAPGNFSEPGRSRTGRRCGTHSTAMRQDEDVFIMGEDIAEMGGSMGVTQGMLDEFGPERVRNTPISEAAIVGTGPARRCRACVLSSRSCTRTSSRSPPSR